MISLSIFPRNTITEIICQNCQVRRAEWLAKIPPYFTSWEFDFWLRLTARQENNEVDIEWERECSEGGRWSSEHKDVELIARVSLNVRHWLFCLRQANRGALVHAFAMKPLGWLRCMWNKQGPTFSTWVGFMRPALLLCPRGFHCSSLVEAKEFNSRER